jgi:hypothetical protein
MKDRATGQRADAARVPGPFVTHIEQRRPEAEAEFRDQPPRLQRKASLPKPGLGGGNHLLIIRVNNRWVGIEPAGNVACGGPAQDNSPGGEDCVSQDHHQPVQRRVQRLTELQVPEIIRDLFVVRTPKPYASSRSLERAFRIARA